MYQEKGEKGYTVKGKAVKATLGAPPLQKLPEREASQWEQAQETQSKAHISKPGRTQRQVKN